MGLGHMVALADVLWLELCPVEDRDVPGLWDRRRVQPSSSRQAVTHYRLVALCVQTGVG